MTKYYEDRNKWKMKGDTPISVRNYEHDTPKVYFCNNCNRTLSKLQDRNGTNISYFCNTCRTEVIPSLTEVRSKSKLVTPEGPIENPSVSHPPELDLRKKKTEIKGTFKKLQERGIKITDYHERGWRRESND